MASCTLSKFILVSKKCRCHFTNFDLLKGSFNLLNPPGKFSSNRQERREMSFMWKELSDYCDLNDKKYGAHKCTSNSTGPDNEVKIGKRSPLHNHRRERSTGNNPGFYSSLYHSQTAHYTGEKSHNRGKYHGQARVSSQNCSSDSPLPINEESSSMKIKIMSAFSLNPNTSISSKGAMAKCGETDQVPFESVDSKNRLANAQIPTIHYYEGVDDSMFSSKTSRNTIQVFKNLATSQNISTENQKLPNYSSTWNEENNPAQPSNRVAVMEAKKKEFQQERNGLHEQFFNNFFEIFDYVLDRSNKKSNERYSQTANVRQKQAPVLLDRCLEAASDSMFAEEVKRTKQVQAFDDSVVTDTLAARGILSSPRTIAGDRLPQKVRLPCQPQPLHLRALQTWKVKNEVLQTSTSPFQGLSEEKHSSAATVSSKVALKKPLSKSANPKRKVLTKNILITPEPELFANLQELNLKNDEEPVVRVPNYFLDFTVEYTKNEPFTLMNSARPNDKNASSPYSDCRVQTMQHTNFKELHSQETSKILHETKPFRRQADSCLIRLSQQNSGINISQDEELDGISALQALAPATSVIDAILQNDNPITPRSKETKPKDKLETTDIRQIYKRIGGAYPSVKPTPDFSRLLPPSSREIARDDSYTIKALALDSNDHQLPVTKKTLYLREGIDREKEFFSTCSSQYGSQTAQNILSARECSSVVKGLVVDKLKCRSSGNYLTNESSGKKIIATCTETSAGQSVTPRLHEGRKHHCDVCGRVFSRRNTLTTHKRIHTGDKPFPCDLCGRAFRQLGNLSRHKLTHAAVKPHVCPKCNKSFSRTSNLNSHLRTHTNYKPFVCDFCGKGFHQNMDMKIHRYTHTGEKPHKCITCGRGFKQLTHLKYHLRTHSAERLYKCQHCGKGFNQKGNLQAHIYGHTGKRPYRCEICGKGFTLTSTLNTHKRIHAPNKPFKCEFCEKAFYQKNALKTHYISSHPYTDGVCLL